MQKIQVLFPDPIMRRLREAAAQQDVPLSEIIRQATALCLDRMPKQASPARRVPTVNAGRCLLDAQAMKEALHE
jgi:predicted DCC family thiol-disulfide oxidoreductase YuxK